MTKQLTNFAPEIAVVTLINKFFWKSKTGPLTMLLLPLCFMIMYRLFSDGDNVFFANALPGFISLTTLPITLITLPQMLVEIKQSIILRRISTSEITAIKYNLLVASWFFVLCIFSTFIIFILFLAFLNSGIDKLSFINWGDLIFSLIMFYISAISVGILISSLAKKSSSAQLIGLGVMLFTLVLAGQFVPLVVIGKVDSIKFISLASPINYSTGLLNNVLTNPGKIGIPTSLNTSGSIFSITDFKIPSNTSKNPIIIIAYWQKVLNLIMPIIIFIGFNIISYKNFKWSVR